MAEWFAHPFAIIVLGAFLCMLVPGGRTRSLILLIIPLWVGWSIWQWPEGEGIRLTFAGLELELMRVDRLSRIFGLIFSLAAFLGNLFAWHLKDRVQQISGLLYAGSAIGAVFAGDLITLFIYWELTAITSVFLIWARRTQGAQHTAMRYLLIQVGSGVLLLGGVALHFHNTGSIAFVKMELGDLASWMILIAFGIKCAFPLLHNWLQDSYPAATVTGTVMLSAFTTKLAVYALARGFPGTELLIYVGTIMTLFPIFFAEIENDLRKVLAYSLNNQLGFMVVGVGIGSELALNGTAAHAFAHILYKALLFMSVGAVLYRTGTSKASELGGLYRTMPVTAIFCLVGAASISAFPLFSGFVAKSLVLSATAENHYTLVWLGLLFASAGVLSHSGIKVPFFAFFAHDSGKRPAEAPTHMLLAMGATAFLCIFIGVYPAPLYALLPYGVDYQPYTTSHVISQLQLLFFALLAFGFLYRNGLHPPEVRAVNLDSDWTYRKLGPYIFGYAARFVGLGYALAIASAKGGIAMVFDLMEQRYDPLGKISGTRPTGSMVIWVTAMLGVVLLLTLA